jgi:hypothetical protein
LERILDIDTLSKDPMIAFNYALKAPESKRRYPKRFKVFLDFLKFPGDLNSQAESFLIKAKQNPTWAQNSFISFIMYLIKRAESGSIAESTISNYYKTAKLFCASIIFQSS